MSDLSKVNIFQHGGVYSFQRQERVSKVKLSDHHNRSFDKCYLCTHCGIRTVNEKASKRKGFKMILYVSDIKRLEFRMTWQFCMQFGTCVRRDSMRQNLNKCRITETDILTLDHYLKFFFDIRNVAPLKSLYTNFPFSMQNHKSFHNHQRTY